MSAGYHAADDGSLARSTGGAAARGAMLIALALAIGLLLMWRALDDPATEVTAADSGAVAEEDQGDDTSDAAVDDATADDTADADDTTDSATLVDPDDSSTESTPEQIPEETDPDAGAPVSGEFLPPSEVNVLVANGIGGQGVAGGTADKLIADGYLANAANAPATAAGVIFYRPGYDANAKAVAEILGAAPDVVQPAPDTIGVSAEAINDGRLAEANIIVIVGADNAVPPPA